VLKALGLPVNGHHNIVHLLSGVTLIYLAYSDTDVTLGAQAFGIVYTLVGLLGLIGGGTVLGLFPVTPLYNLIHLIIGVGGLYAGFGREAAKA
jgi:hypothetical protein